MNEHNLSDEELDRWVEISTDSDRARRTELFGADFRRLRAAGFTHIHRHYFSQWDGFSERKTAIEAAGLPILQEKRTFAWNEPRPAVAVPERLVFRSLAEVGEAEFLAAVEAGRKEMLDRAERAERAALGDRPIGEALREEWQEITEYFAYEPEWFQLAYNEENELVGYTQPVIYPGANKGELEEASLYYIAVLPEQRGKAYIDDILAQSVATMQKVGVWRIYCDTDSENFPMIGAFERAGFAEEGTMYKWRGEIAALLS